MNVQASTEQKCDNRPFIVPLDTQHSLLSQERDMTALKVGYPGLSRLMGENDGYGMLKRFAALNMRNLLYTQAELVRRENELKL